MKHFRAVWFALAAEAVLLAAGAMVPGLAIATNADAPMSVEALTRTSSNVVEGTVESIACSLEPNGIFTHVRIKVGESLKGTSPGTVVVRLYGGTSNGKRTIVLGGPVFAEREEVLLFLTRLPGLESYGVVGLSQGKFGVDRVRGRSATVHRDLRGISFNNRSNDEPPAALDQIEAAVRVEAR